MLAVGTWAVSGVGSIFGKGAEKKIVTAPPENFQGGADFRIYGPKVILHVGT